MLFVYGTLQDAAVLRSVLGHPSAAAACTGAQLDGFTVLHYPGRTYPVIVPAANSSAPGKIISGLDARDLALLDAFEGHEYRRTPHAVTLNAKPVYAFACLSTASIAASQTPWSFKE